MKRLFLSTLLLIFISEISAQDTLYLKSNWKEATNKSEAAYLKVIIKDPANPKAATEKIFYSSGRPYSETFFSDYPEKIRDGKRTMWYENGKKRSDVFFRDGENHGSFITYWPNGEKKRIDLFHENELLEGKTFDSTGSEIPYYSFEIRPEFPGGKKELFQYIKDNLDYPAQAEKKGITGKVIIKFAIEPTGEISNVAIVEGPIALRLAAYNVVKEMPSWTPGYQDGLPVRVWYSLPISFKK